LEVKGFLRFEQGPLDGGEPFERFRIYEAEVRVGFPDHVLDLQPELGVDDDAIP
jgi:hypothetical protein